MDKRGFTLVELLAVIVVLAIVMLIAVQAVLPQMEKARRQAMVLEGQTIIEAAQSYYISEALKAGGDGLPATAGQTKCVTISKLENYGVLNIKSGDTAGYVTVTKASTGNTYLYKVYFTKGQLMINGKGSDTAKNVPLNEESDVVAKGTLATQPTGCAA